MSNNTIPSAPNLEFYRKQAKALLKSVSSGDTAAFARILQHIPHGSNKRLLLADTQWVLAREHGFASWPKFLRHLDEAAAGSLHRSELSDGSDPSDESDQSASDPSELETSPQMGTKPSGGQQIGTDAVYAKTGRHWDEWFAILDAAGCAQKTHKEIVAVAAANGVGSWWQQMIAVEYERARGLRDTNMNCDGDYNVSASKTIAASVEALFAAWTDPELREKWLPGASMTIRKAVTNKRILITWHDGGSATVNFYPKSDTKCQCNIEHTKLANKDVVEQYRSFWTSALERLRLLLEA